MGDIAGISKAPVYGSDRSALGLRTIYNFRDYGFEIAPGAHDAFEVVPTRITEEECFLFFFSRDDILNGRWALFNLHVFLKRTGPLETFARSLGESVKTVPLSPVIAFGTLGLGYTRNILMADLFKGGEQVITFIGGEPDRLVRDSHYYFQHRHAHCYSGVIHPPGEEARYDALRGTLFEIVRLVD